MSPEYRTKTLANVYENQGHFQDALDIYRELDQESSGDDAGLKAACRRLEAALAASGDETAAGPEDRAAHLLEQWLRLLILEKRLGQFEKIQARLQ